MISKSGKMIKGVKKVAKRAKKVYKKKLTTHFHHCILTIDQKGEKSTFLKKLILGDSVDKMNFHLYQVSTNAPPLQSNSSIMHLFLFLRGCTLLKRVALHVRGLSKDNSHMYSGRKHYARVHTRLWPIQPTYTLKILEKIKSKS